MCVKTKPVKNGLTRDEFECDISRDEYESLLKKTEGIIIEKTRYLKKDEFGYTMEIDVFKGALDGLCYVEVEFPTEAESVLYKSPDWVIRDVTSEKRYKNAALAKYGKLVEEK